MQPAVLIVGAGGHALVAIDALRRAGHDVAGCLSPDGTAGADLAELGVDVVGTTDQLGDLVADGRPCFVAIGDNAARRRLTADVVAAGGTLVAAVDPAAVVAATATIAEGALVMPGAIVNALATVGAGAIVNTGATVDHECDLGAFSHVAPNASLAGRVTVGEGAFVGIGAAVVPARTIGEWAVVGAGATVVQDVPPHRTAVGTPARLLASADASVASDDPVADAADAPLLDHRDPAPAPALATPDPDEVTEASEPRSDHDPTDDERPPRVLVVCTGNLCRSPLVAALLRRELASAGVEAQVESAGTGAPFRVAPDRRLVKAADRHGIDVRDHRSQPVTREQLAAADLILTMTNEHSDEVQAILPDAAARTVPLRAAAWRSQIVRGGPLPFAQWVGRVAGDVVDGERVRPGPSADIADPMGGPQRGYRAMADEVASLVSTLVARWSGR